MTAARLRAAMIERALSAHRRQMLGGLHVQSIIARQQRQRAANRRKALEELRKRRERHRESISRWVKERARQRAAEQAALAAMPSDDRQTLIAEKYEDRAGARLKLARSLKARGKPAAAHKWLLRLVEQYPETAAAGDARQLLQSLPGSVIRR